ncbi:transcriptional regulator [Vibrio sp. MACH09]|nr:transcriptional regulator [Vibrio sp. MACH09]
MGQLIIVRNNAQWDFDVENSDFKANIATHLKQIRASKGISLDATAKLTGVSKAMLGQIERQESSPTIAKLWQIASGLNVSFSAFFATEQSLRLSENTFPDDHNMQVKTLFPFAADTAMEMFEITLKQHHQQISSPHAFGVVEHVCVLSGEIELLIEGEWQSFSEGKSVRFFADQDHGYRAVSETVIFHNIVCYPK